MGNKIPRGIRNNNPGNIRYNGIPWQGLKNPPSDGSFCVFTAPKWGIRALTRVLRIYQTKYGICTIAEIINRFAPSNENDALAYIHSVSKKTGIGARRKLDLQDTEILVALVTAIIYHENGQQPYTDEQILEGIRC